MRIPGLNAEMSIYRSAVHYQSGAPLNTGSEQLLGPEQIAPSQQFPTPRTQLAVTGPRACPCPPFAVCIVDSSSPTGCMLAGQTCYCEPIGVPCTGCVCPPSWTYCGKLCVNLKTSWSNCGTCGHVCPPNQNCENGVCVCASPYTLCGSDCVDSSSDPSNCGSCGNLCPSYMICSNATCVCPSGLSLCGTDCVDLSSDPSNCGSCGNLCTGEKICSNGTCICPPGLTDCGELFCTDLSIDPQNCGSCGSVCSSPDCCMEGSCGVECGGGCCPAGFVCVIPGVLCLPKIGWD
jgi:hypothetical protein